MIKLAAWTPTSSPVASVARLSGESCQRDLLYGMQGK